MPTPLDEVLARLDKDTTAVAQTIKALRDRVSTDMTEADVTSVQTTLDALATRLEATAADPANPIPAGPVPVLAKKRKP